MNKFEQGRVSRRRFLEIAASITAMCSMRAELWATEERGGIPYKTFGSTGEKVSAIGLGGYHIGRPADEESLRIIRTAIDGGINFMDNCWDCSGLWRFFQEKRHFSWPVQLQFN